MSLGQMKSIENALRIASHLTLEILIINHGILKRFGVEGPTFGAIAFNLRENVIYNPHVLRNSRFDLRRFGNIKINPPVGNQVQLMSV